MAKCKSPDHNNGLSSLVWSLVGAWVLGTSVFLSTPLSQASDTNSRCSHVLRESLSAEFAGEQAQTVFARAQAFIASSFAQLSGEQPSLANEASYPVARFFDSEFISEYYNNKAQALLSEMNELKFKKIVTTINGVPKNKLPKIAAIKQFNSLRVKAQELRGLMQSLGTRSIVYDGDSEALHFYRSKKVYNKFVSAWGNIKDEFLGMNKKVLKGSRPLSRKQKKVLSKKSNVILKTLKQHDLENLLDTFIPTDAKSLQSYISNELRYIRQFNGVNSLTGWEYHQLRKSMKVMQWIADYVRSHDPHFRLHKELPRTDEELNPLETDPVIGFEDFSIRTLTADLKEVVKKMGSVHDQIVRRGGGGPKYNYRNDSVITVDPAVQNDIQISIQRLALLFQVEALD